MGGRSTAIAWLTAAVVLTLAAKPRAEISEEPIARLGVYELEQVTWSPSGDAVWVSTIDDMTGTSTVSRLAVNGGGSGAATLDGTIRAFWPSPDGRRLASIHESAPERVLQVWDTREWRPREVERDTWNMYFPLVNTVTPWDASGESLLFYKARFHERKLCLWDSSKDTVQMLGEGRRVDRAFWGEDGGIFIPQGLTLGQVTAGQADVIRGFTEVDPATGKTRARAIPRGYTSFFPFTSVGMGILKDPSPPPMAVNLRTWETAALPRSLGRFLEVAWEPGGRRLAYPVNQNEIHRVECFDLASGETRLLWIDPGFMAGSVAWSPSGRYVACSLLEARSGSSERLLVLKAETGEGVWVMNRSPEVGTRYYGRGRPSLFWSPAQDKLLYWDLLGELEEERVTEFRVVTFSG